MPIRITQFQFCPCLRRRKSLWDEVWRISFNRDMLFGLLAKRPEGWRFTRQRGASTEKSGACETKWYKIKQIGRSWIFQLLPIFCFVCFFTVAAFSQPFLFDGMRSLSCAKAADIALFLSGNFSVDGRDAQTKGDHIVA